MSETWEGTGADCVKSEGPQSGRTICTASSRRQFGTFLVMFLGIMKDFSYIIISKFNNETLAVHLKIVENV